MTYPLGAIEREKYLQLIDVLEKRAVAAEAECERLRDALSWLGTLARNATDRLHAALADEMPASIADKLGLERTADGELQVRAG